MMSALPWRTDIADLAHQTQGRFSDSIIHRLRVDALRRDHHGCDFARPVGSMLVTPLICPTGRLLTGVSSPLRKNISLLRQVETALLIRPSCPTQRGVSRTSRTSGRDAMDAAARETGDANADGEVVWS
jgi:hypothetical protein